MEGRLLKIPSGPVETEPVYGGWRSPLEAINLEGGAPIRAANMGNPTLKSSTFDR